jgi:hypothetical protein
MQYEDLWIDLSDIELQDLEILTQEGARAIPEFAASTDSCDWACCGRSTSVEDPSEEAL